MMATGTVMLMGAMMPTRAAIMVTRTVMTRTVVTRTVVMMRTMAMLGTVAMTLKVTARTCMPVLLDPMITVKREMEVTRKPSKLSRTTSRKASLHFFHLKTFLIDNCFTQDTRFSCLSQHKHSITVMVGYP